MKMPAMSSCKAGQHTYHLLLPRRLKHSDGILKRAWKRRPAIQHTKCCSRTYNGRPMSSLFDDAVFGLNQPIGHVLLGNRFRETVPGKPCTAACHFFWSVDALLPISELAEVQNGMIVLPAKSLDLTESFTSQTGAIHQIGKPRYTVLPAQTMSWAGIIRGRHVP